MTPQDLLAAFGTLADAPDGVTRLREMVLKLAVNGDLVPQDPEDQPAGEMVAALTSDSSWRLPERERRGTLDPSIEALASVREVPDGWCEARLEDLAQLINGRAYKRQELLKAGTPVIRIQNLNGGQDWYYSDLTLPDHQYCDSGDLLFAWSASFGPYLWERARAIFHYHIWKLNLSKAVHKRFLLYVLMDLTESVRGQSHGLAMLHMTKGKMERWPVLLPPLAEQQRIVARVDELMGLLDRLEAARNAREGTRTALRDAALAALQNADTPEEVEVAWQRIAERMDDLFTEPADVDPLRQTVLQLAVRGRLVPQDPDDEPASVLLGRIAEEKARLVKRGVIRKPRPATAVPRSEVPYEVPAPWTWTCLGTIAATQTGATPKKSLESGRGPKIPYLKPADLGFMRADHGRLIARSAAEDTGRIACAGSVLFVGIGGSIGKCGLAREDVTFNQQVHAATPVIVAPQFAQLLLASPYFQASTAEKTSATAIPIINKSRWEGIPLPLPPLAEQHRIVARVDELMGLLDRLEQHLLAKRDTHDAFAAAAVHHLEA